MLGRLGTPDPGHPAPIPSVRETGGWVEVPAGERSGTVCTAPPSAPQSV